MFVTLQITERCNFECFYCFEGKKEEKTMSLEQGKRAIDFIFDQYKMQENKVQIMDGVDISISFYGGEPLLEFELMKELYSYSEEKAIKENLGTSYMIITNGSLMDEEKCEFFKQRPGKFDVKFSLDGDCKTQNYQRPFKSGEPSFQVVLENIKLYRDQVQKSFRVSMVVTPGSASSFYENIRFLFNEGIQEIEYDIDMHSAWDTESMQIYEREIDKVMNFYLEQLEINPAFKVVSIDQWMRPIVHPQNECLRCGSGKSTFFINVEGKIYVCPLGNKIEVCCFGDIENGLNDNVNVLSQYKDEDLQPECLECENRTKCYLACIAQNYILTNNIVRIAPVQCARGSLHVRKAIDFGNRFYKQNPNLFHERFKVEKKEVSC